MNSYFHTELARARIQDAHHIAARHRLVTEARRPAEIPPAQNRLIGRSARAGVAPRTRPFQPAWAAFAPSDSPKAWTTLDATTSN